MQPFTAFDFARSAGVWAPHEPPRRQARQRIVLSVTSPPKVFTLKHSLVQFKPDATAWLRLLRVPNLFSVPGDPLAGLAAAVLAGALLPDWKMLAGVAGVALCLYCAGLILNDLHDRKRDALLRPERPLPSGQIRVPAAVAVMLMFTGVALALAAAVGRDCFCTALLLAGAIAAYNLLLKDLTVPGALTMGACRGFSVLLAVPLSHWYGLPLFLAGTVTVYVVGLTLISRGEDHKLRYGVPVWIPSAAVVCGGAGLVWGGWDVVRQVHPAWLAVAAVGAGLAVAVSARLAWELYGREAEPAAARRAVGLLIRQLPVLQCAILVLVPGTAWLGVAILLLAWTLARPLARRFSGA